MVEATEQTVQGRSPGSGDRTRHGAVAGLSLVASLGAATAGSCCALPLALASMGIGGAWLGGLGALAPYRPHILGVAVLGLGLGWLSAFRNLRRRTCGIDGACAREPGRRLTLGLLTISTALVLFAALSDWLEPMLVQVLLDWR